MELDPWSATVALRVFNLGSSMILATITLGVTAVRWRSLPPSNRLFAFGFLMYVAYAVVTSYLAITRAAPPSITAPLLAVANVWLIGAIIVLQVEYVRGLKDGSA